MDRLRQISQQLVTVQEWPEFNAGDTLKVSYKIKEGAKERTQIFQGTVIQRRGEGPTATFTVRKMASGVGVERVFPISSPFLEAVEVMKRGKVRRARIYYLRGLTGKSARIKEKRTFSSSK
jgi:large subunit ribosomal protein L19